VLTGMSLSACAGKHLKYGASSKTAANQENATA
jgi:hypothetical protein